MAEKVKKINKAFVLAGGAGKRIYTRTYTNSFN